ncbi:MAG: hypothetical protein CL910_04655 [Deltaproteobacteria bacterium]|jgi:hypothetical protein|nr:hypothetical protein [Deltaproteobacteria bacterium]
MTTAIVCIVLLGLLVFGLGFAVSMARGRNETLIGASSDPTDSLHKLVRAHGNAAEFAPMLALLIWVAAIQDAGSGATACAVLGTVARYLHAAGMILPATLDAANPLRFVGALGTYLAGLGLCLFVLLSLSG